jgi:geranyl-CoA carboxylase beta subunit
MPFVQLIESAGANLLKSQVEGFVEGGRIFYNLARLSAEGIPVVAVVPVVRQRRGCRACPGCRTT